MGNASAKAADVKVLEAPAPATAEKPKLKPCCACPETKRVRDACIIEKGEENCGDLIEEHKACMRKMGFNI
ncbi:cytochrome c oxidase copper chaperone [Ostrinia furnacalis]|uniref:cytochrome c oxidase copper chaperone n=1 Tax=Ostrinia furnacalis TaxID=93504 RepID=UPI00103A303A|nr:cytochrome c oxidase copper chaperone [Ostrinia furnacalis]